MSRSAGHWAMKLSIAALLAAPMVFFSVGCNPECVDKFDCASKITTDSPNWTCSAGKCVEGDPGGYECTMDSECTDNPNGAYCNTTDNKNVCVECTADSQCGAGNVCVDNACEAGGTGGGGGGMDAGTGGGGGGGDMDAGTGGGGGMDAGTGGGGGTDPLVNTYSATLNGANEVPANASTETGTATVAVTAAGDGGYSADVSITHTIAPGQTTAAHIHNSIAGRTGAPIITLASGQVSATFTGTFPVDPAQAQEMKDGRTYINIHTSTYAGGEIRGQLLEAGKSVAWAILDFADGGTATNSGVQMIYPTATGPVTGADVSWEGDWTGSGLTATAASFVDSADGGVWIDLGATGMTVTGTMTLTADNPAAVQCNVDDANGTVLQGTVMGLP